MTKIHFTEMGILNSTYRIFRQGTHFTKFMFIFNNVKTITIKLNTL
jgi:hypothetical protein